MRHPIRWLKARLHYRQLRRAIERVRRNDADWQRYGRHLPPEVK